MLAVQSTLLAEVTLLRFEFDIFRILSSSAQQRIKNVLNVSVWTLSVSTRLAPLSAARWEWINSSVDRKRLCLLRVCWNIFPKWEKRSLHMKLVVSTGNLNLTWIRMKIRKLKTLNDWIINHRNILDEETKTEYVFFFAERPQWSLVTVYITTHLSLCLTLLN